MSAGPAPDLPARGPWLGGWQIALPIVVAAALRDLWAPDEPRYAQVAREAFEGDLLVLHLNGELYPDKPPLVYWLAGLCGDLSGWNEFALRLPSIVATLVTAWITARLARRLWGDLEARWAPLFFLGTAMVLEIGGRLQIDPVLTALCLAAIERATDDRGTRARRSRRLLAGGVLAGLAAMAKGPVAWLHVGVGVIALHAARARERDNERPGRWVWSWFALLALVPVVAWAAIASLSEPRLFGALFFGQHLGRMVEATQHPGPPWEHLLHFPLYFLPFTPLFVAAIALAWRRTDRALAAIAVWFAVVFAVFSAIPVKRDLYLLPIYPAAALLCARVLAEGMRRRPLRAWVGTTANAVVFGFGSLFTATGVALLVAGDALRNAIAHRESTLELVDFLTAEAGDTVIAGIVLVTGARFAHRQLRRASTAAGFDVLANTCSAAALVLALGVLPALDPHKSPRALAAYLAARPEKPIAIPCLGVQPEGYRFYARVPTVKEDFAAALDRDGPRFLALAWRKEYDELLSDAVRARMRLITTWRVGAREILVLGAKQ